MMDVTGQPRDSRIRHQGYPQSGASQSAEEHRAPFWAGTSCKDCVCICLVSDVGNAVIHTAKSLDAMFKCKTLKYYLYVQTNFIN